MGAITLSLLRDFGDRFSPIVVKELRQGLRTRFFSVATILFHSFVVLLLGSVLLAAPAEAVNGIFWGTASLMMLAVLPLRAFNALNAEAADGTLDMLTLTSISAFRIVSGKWLALFSQSLLVAGSLLPYIVARYYFGGVEIVREVVALVVLVLGSGIITAALLAFSSQSSIMLRLMLAAGAGFGAVPLGFFTSFLVAASRADFMLRDFAMLATWEQAGIVVEVFAMSVYVIWYLLALGASRIAPPSENHSTRKRLIVLGVHGVLLIIGLVLCFLSGDEHNALWVLMPLLGLTMLVCMDVMTEEMPRFPIAVAGLAGRGRWGRLAGRVLHPGWASGVVFSSLLSLLSLVLTGAVSFADGSWDWEDGPFLHLVCLLTAMFMPVLIPLNRGNAFANWWVVQICLCSLGVLVVIGGETAGKNFGLVGMVTPVTTLFAVETVGYQNRDMALLMGSLFALGWLVAALLRARMNFEQYTRLEAEAEATEPPSATLSPP